MIPKIFHTIFQIALQLNSLNVKRALFYLFVNNMDSSEDVEMLDNTKKIDAVASNSEESSSKSKANIPW